MGAWVRCLLREQLRERPYVVTSRSYLAELLLERVGHLDQISLDALGTQSDLVVGLRDGVVNR